VPAHLLIVPYFDESGVLSNVRSPRFCQIPSVTFQPRSIPRVERTGEIHIAAAFEGACSSPTMSLCIQLKQVRRKRS
jgi:hypothetical protein